MTHSHIPIKHLLKQMKIYSYKRINRDLRPDWVTNVINDVAELFEPLAGLGRVGFDCQLSDDGWVVGLYLGSTETIGGKEDGIVRHTNYEIDLQQLIIRFDRLDEFCFGAFPSPVGHECHQARSFVTLAGTIGEETLRLQIFSTPPNDAGPGLRQLPDGRCEPV